MRGNKSWIEVSEGALRANLETLRRVLSSTESKEESCAEATSLLAVIKADAYGHGATVCAPALARAGVRWLGVTDAAEGAAVRDALTADGIAATAQPEVLVMCGLERGDAATIVEHRLTPVVWFAAQVEWLARHTRGRTPLPVHVEVDTGMARQGVLPGNDLDRLLEQLARTPELRLDGVMTHFAAAEVAGSPLTRVQQQRFDGALDQVCLAGVHPQWLHAGNTATLDELHLLPWLGEEAARCGARLLARTGLALYGYALPLEGAVSALGGGLRAVGAWRTHVIAMRDLAAGEAVGYNATFVASQPMRLALLPVGYADGLRRELSGTDRTPGGWVMVRGQPAPIVGRVSMNLTTVDVSAISDAALGDEAELLGEGFTADDHARVAGTIAYDILCAMRGTQQLVP